jgi:hypothetical protein
MFVNSLACTNVVFLLLHGTILASLYIFLVLPLLRFLSCFDLVMNICTENTTSSRVSTQPSPHRSTTSRSFWVQVQQIIMYHGRQRQTLFEVALAVMHILLFSTLSSVDGLLVFSTLCSSSCLNPDSNVICHATRQKRYMISLLLCSLFGEIFVRMNTYILLRRTFHPKV